MSLAPYRADFISNWEFFSEVFVPENNLELPLKAAHKKICDALEDAFLGLLPEGIEYLIINVAPRIGKTKMVEATACWAEGYYPDAQFIFTAYAAALAETSLSYIGDTLSRPWYRDLFHDMLHARRSDHLMTVDGGNLFAEGTGGSLTGKGAGLKRPAGGMLVIDDASKPDEALSPVESKKKQQWIETTCKNRRNSDRWCPIVIIGQRLGPEDVPGYFLKTYPEKCLLIKIPTLVDPKTGEASQADDAVSIFPETVSSATLLDYRKTRIGRFVLASQYQQEPIALGGNLIPVDTFGRWDPTTPLRFERTVITVDTALKIKQSNDYSAAALWGLLDRRAYLIDLIHGKWESPDLVRMVGMFWLKWTSEGSPDHVPRPRLVIEEKAAGTPLLQSLRALGVPATGIERDQDKVRRVQNVLPHIETGMVLIPATGTTPWIEKYETELSQFAADGTAAHDDMVDTMVDGIEQLLGAGFGILDVLRPAAAPTSGPIFPRPRQPTPMRA